MPVIQITETVPTPNGAGAPAVGSMEWTPTAAFASGATEVLPAPFTVYLDGTGSATVTVAATGTSWCWRVIRSYVGVPPSTAFVAVASTDTQWANLTRVDPATLAPVTVANVTDAWVSGLVTNTSSQTRTALDSVYPQRSAALGMILGG